MRVNPGHFGDCIAKIAAKGSVSAADARELLNEVADRGDRLRRLGEDDPFGAAARDLASKLKETAKADRIDALRNAEIRTSLLDQVDKLGGLPKAEQAIRSLLHGTNVGGRDSVQAMWRGNSAAWQAQLSSALRKAGLEKVAISGDMDGEIAKALWARNAGERLRGDGNNPARQIADAIYPLLDHVRDRLNAVGARIGDAADYVAHTLHDPAKMRRAAGPGKTPGEAFEAWWQATRPRLAQKTFEDVIPREGETMLDAERRFGRSVFDGLITGVHMTPEGAFGVRDGQPGGKPAFEGTYNLARKLSSPRVLFWRDGGAWNAHMQQFGATRSIAEGVMLTLDKSARQLALMDKLGTNPAGNLNLVMRAIQERYRGDLDGIKKFQAKVPGIDAVMAHLDGRANIPANEMWARLGAGLRTWESMSSLGGVGVTHFASVFPTVTSELAHHGVSRISAIGNIANALLKGRRGSEAHADVMAQLGAYSDGLVREMYARWQPDDPIPGRLSSLANTFMKYTGVRYVFDNSQAAVREMLANSLARNLGKRFEDLDPHLSQILGKYGIDAESWRALGSIDKVTAADGRQYLTPRDALNIDAAHAEKLLRSRGTITEGSGDDAISEQVGKFAQSLSDKLYAYYGDAAAHSVVTAGVRERAAALGAERPGSFGGELRRFVMQFKMWPLAAMNQILGRELHMSLSRGEAAWNLGMLVGISTIGGYTRMAINAAASGKPMPDASEPSVLLEASAKGGGLGILGDFIFGEVSRMNGGLIGALGGPVVGDADQLIKIFGQWKTSLYKKMDGTEPLDSGGSKKDWWADLARFASRKIPFGNLIYLKGALDYLLWYHLYEAASPGWWERTNRRMLREQGSAMTGYVPGGGIPWSPWGVGANDQGGEQQSSAAPASGNEAAPQRMAAAEPVQQPIIAPHEALRLRAAAHVAASSQAPEIRVAGDFKAPQLG